MANSVLPTPVGPRKIKDPVGRVGFEDYDGDKDKAKSELARDELKKYFNPEFLNRVDEVIYFQPLKQEEIVKIVSIMLKDFNERLFEKKIMISMTTGKTG